MLFQHRSYEVPGTAEGEDPALACIGLNEAAFREHAVEGDRGVGELMASPYDVALAIDPDGEMESTVYKRQAMAAMLGRMKDGLDAQGVPFLVVLIPSASEVHPERGGDPVAEALAGLEAYDPRNRCAFYAGILEELEIGYVDLFDVLAAEPTDPALAEEVSPYFFPRHDDHWNPAGQAVSAEAVAAAIRDRGMLE